MTVTGPKPALNLMGGIMSGKWSFLVDQNEYENKQ